MKQKTIIKDLVYPGLSYQVVGLLFEVSNKLGGNYQEKYYQKAVALELRQAGLKFKEQVRFPLKYKNEPLGAYCPDFLIDDKIVVEIKNNKNFTPKNIQQVYTYLKAFDLKLGILTNFTNSGLIFKRIVNIKD